MLNDLVVIDLLFVEFFIEVYWKSIFFIFIRFIFKVLVKRCKVFFLLDNVIKSLEILIFFYFYKWYR